MIRMSLRMLGPIAYLSATLALAWASAAWGALTQEEDGEDHSQVVPIPWVGS